jgi:hydroxymethylpyrimidine kinase/phosphomethylpyrimidine kinase
VHEVPPDVVVAQIDAVVSDIGVDAVKTGMLLTAGTVESVVKKVKEYRLEKLIVDPVMVAKGGHFLMQDKSRNALIKKLLPLTLVVTPNIPEAEALAQMKIGSVAAMKKAAVIIRKLGAKNVLIKGGHLPGSKRSGALDILFDGEHYDEFSSPWIDTKNTHGTGCTYASALAAGIAKGESIFNAAWHAKITVTAAIENALCPGKGYGSVNVFGKIF